MSFFGFDATGRHNTAAPGFSQAQDPFAGLSSRDDAGDDALDFEDTYDGLGDQLDDTEDAFNDDTFGGDASGTGKVGKDFDFFGQTAKVADAIEEEHLRFNRQQPAPRSSIARTQPLELPAELAAQYQYSGSQPTRPNRTGYEKYREAEPMPDLHVDQSIWGIGSSKAAVPATTQQAAQPQPPSSRKIMSLEEVEAAMRAQSKQPTHAPTQEPAPYSTGQPGYPSQQQPPPPPQYPQQHHGQAYPGHGPAVTILQRPQSLHAKHPVSTDKFSAPPAHQHQQQQHRQQAHPSQPMQILQNPNRLPGDADRLGLHGHRPSRSHGSVPKMTQMHAHPHMMQMSEDEKGAFLEQETKRAKRNHKIWLLSKDNGLMTPQDKNFITRIQLQQLVSATGNPVDKGGDMSLSEDFYYKVYSHIRAGQRQNPSQPLSNFAQTYLFQTGTRHGGARRHGRPAENHIQRMEQQVQRAVEAAKNKPKNPQLVIAGSLGKISFSNAKTPKPLLNIKRAESEAQRPSTGKKAPENGLDRKRILRNVEKVYDTLMKIEDHARFIPPPLSGQHDPELEEKHKEWAVGLDALNAKLWDELKVHEPIGLTVPHPFIAFLSCAKGKKAIPRIFPHLSFEQRTTILTMIIYHLDQLDVIQGAVDDNGETNLNSRMRENIELFISTVMPSLMQYFNDTGLDIVDGVLNLIATKLNVDLIARTRIGVSMLTLILSRAVLLKQTGGGNTEQWDKWDQTFEILFSKLEPSLSTIFPGSVNAGVDVHVWQLLAAMGVSATHDQQTRLVLAVKDRVLDTVALSKTLPPAMATERLGSVNLFMRAIGLDVELLQ
ncbi:topoisomerase II-associated protein PAT1 domain-containing protein [Hirsutella rhossiliensis]|uniref:Topoisomerase II-associated protein PAT1 domain-containing protein n=1 Tax=Hirsutella rhossiliensis TaxID=111463 RepID=A0A9P8N404_9HYPO|nr:topoisomerase II-associated protein PAT1 domain-containing protein [Hirsutella rhossiliensis]KAH0966527.1 topoisomerase II-associated protein PAT1 domain-containing protein [Hirsutella rhossiliensis]